MLILFLVLVTLGVTNSDPYDTRSKAANAAIRNTDPSLLQRQQGPKKGLLPNEALNLEAQNLQDEYIKSQNNGVPNQGYPVQPQTIIPIDTEGNAYAALQPNGYGTVNVGNGSGKKNTVILNQGNDRNDDELLVAVNKNNHYNPDVQGIPYNENDGTSPCYQNGVPIPGYACKEPGNNGAQYPGQSNSQFPGPSNTQYPGSSNYPKRYNIGNGHNNENVVTINGGGRGPSGASRISSGSKPNRPAFDISGQRQRSQGNGGSNNYFLIGAGQGTKNLGNTTNTTYMPLKL